MTLCHPSNPPPSSKSARRGARATALALTLFAFGTVACEGHAIDLESDGQSEGGFNRSQPTPSSSSLPGPPTAVMGTNASGCSHVEDVGEDTIELACDRGSTCKCFVNGLERSMFTENE